MHTKRLHNPAAEAALAADLFTATPDFSQQRPTRPENLGDQAPGERPEAFICQQSRRPAPPWSLLRWIWSSFGLRGGCTSSRLDHGLKVEFFAMLLA